MMRTPRKGFGEANLPSRHLPGDIKERLQVKPELPAKKKPAGDHWVENKSVDRMGPVAAVGENDGVAAQRRVLPLNNYERTAVDNIDAENHAILREQLATEGSCAHQGTLKEHFTDESCEPLYETVKDKQTGKEGLLYRNNLFDRY